VTYILNRVGRGDILKGYTFSTTLQTEMRSLIYFNLIDLKLKIKRECVNRIDIACRLWKVFQLNGYLPECPRFQLQMARDDYSVRELSNLSISVYIIHLMLTSGIKTHKLMAMHSAYRDVPVKLLLQVRDVYTIDFKPVNYEPEPPEIFTWTSYS
jgi:hypothetical protein